MHRTLPAKLACLALLSGLGCARDPHVAIPEAQRHSADADAETVTPPQPYQSISEDADSIAGATPPADAGLPETDETAPSVEPTPPVTETGEAPNVEAPSDELSPNPTPLPESKGPIDNGRYLFQGVGSKRCLDVPAGSTTNGTQMQIWECNETNPNQIFTLEWVSKESAYRVKASTGKQIQVAKDRIAATSPLIIGDAGDGPHSLFLVEVSGGASIYRFRLKDTAFVFDVSNGLTDNGKTLEVYTAWNPPRTHQQWTLIKAK